jgi:hypothetical protein
MKQSVKHILIVAAILLATSFVYAKLPTAYFCAYDDFLEVHRAAFEDTRDPKRVFTTTHFTSYKYRPLNRGINLITYWAGSGKATDFRTRNVFCHLLNVVLIYLLAWFLFRRPFISGTAALLFGLHPLANHAVVGAVMTNTAAHSLFLISIIAFLLSTRERVRGRYLWLGLALLCGWLSLLTYEAAIVAYPLVFIYLGIQFLAKRNWPVSRAYTIVLTAGCLLFLGLYYVIHARYVPYSAKEAVPGFSTMLKSTAMYTVALVLPIDPVMANTWFGTPLPSDIEVSSGSSVMRVFAFAGVVLVAVLVWIIVRFRRERVISREWPAQLFVAAGAMAAIAPLIIFTDKPSETYMYLTVGLAAVFFASVLAQLIGSRASRRRRFVFAIVVSLLCVSYAAATWVRNNRVARCGETAKQIVSALQQDRFKSGLWFIWLAPVRGEPQSHRYGMYGWRGIDTVGVTAVQEATQLANGNEMLSARVLTPEALAEGCKNSRDVCFVVHENGKLDEVGHPTARR